MRTLKQLLLCLSAMVWSLSTLQAQLYDVIVAQDGTGDYLTIQDAILSIRDYKPEGRQRILVKKGTYEEKVIVPTYKTNISLIGEDRDSCILIWHDHANLQNTGRFEGVVLGSVADAMGHDNHLIHGSDRGHRAGTFESYTLLVLGEGFECENMTIVNDAMTHYNPDWYQTHSNAAKVGQAVTVHSEGDRTVFRNCHIHGFQDTVFTGNARSRQIFYGCYIDGTVDFIFGPATVWFEDCESRSIGNGYLTAASTPAENPYGYVFKHCKVTAEPNVKAYLGRPWRNWANVIFMECELPATIYETGWNNWGDPARELTTRYAEYKNTGAGANPAKRVAWSRQLTDAEAAAVTLENVMHAQARQWNPNVKSLSFDDAVQSYYDYNAQHGNTVRYVGGTLEPKTLPEDVEKFVEPLVINLDSVDCTTFVEYISAATLGRNPITYENDSILRRYVQALRYKGGKRGNYTTRNHYFSSWISNGEAQGLMTEITKNLTGARQQQKNVRFMTMNTRLYPQLQQDTKMLLDVKETERALSAQFSYYIPSDQISRCYEELQHGDIVAFVTNNAGLDIQHVGFVWKPKDAKMPKLLHASSFQGKVVVSDLSLQDYAMNAKKCKGIRIVRLNSTL